MIFRKSFDQLQQQIKYSTNSQSNILDISIIALLKKTIIINNTQITILFFILVTYYILFILKELQQQHKYIN
jgi:hypothetical protein